MKNKNLLYRFNEYQKERFPFAVLIFTTLSVVLSSAAVVDNNLSLVSQWKNIVVGTITCLLFLFNIRVFDDFKDENFDDEFHKKRPIQRGLISLTELNIINLIFLIIQTILNFFISLYAFMYWALALIYSLIARAEFFMKNFIRKKFILYNTLNLFQMLFLQIYLYALIEPDFSISNSLLAIHFIFVLTNAVILEIARKLKGNEEESLGKDTYSGRYGVKTASIIYAVSFLITYLLFLVILLQLSHSIVILIVSLAPLLLIILSTINYYMKRNKLSSKIVEGTAILFYLSMHLLLVGSVL